MIAVLLLICWSLAIASIVCVVGAMEAAGRAERYRAVLSELMAQHADLLLALRREGIEVECVAVRVDDLANAHTPGDIEWGQR